jgi:hypothetical protein
MKRTTWLALGLAALAGAAAPVAAQTEPIDFTFAIDQLHEAVMGLASPSTESAADLKTVARLHARVVAMRAPTDPHRYQCLMDQAALLLALEDVEGARTYVAQASAELAPRLYGEAWKTGTIFVED